ncbi:MAG TPA: alpha-amylase family glycosyl hydrolase, partial [Myxococcaceae bacterium]|nr:alpha-amylase family glycosyl hydrolase [Myxococcaceae bacterium]
GEVYLDNLERWARYYGDGGNAFHLCFNFNLLLARWDAPTLRAAVEDALRVLPEGAVPAVVLGSHDASRVATRHGKVRVRAAALLLLTLPGTPVLYCGEEIGMEDVPVPPERRRDPATLEGGRTRDPERAPMRWSAQRSAGPYAGFSPAEPWLPIGRIGPGDTVEEQRADPSSVFNFYRRLLAFRRASPALTQGHYVARPDTPSTCYAFERRSGAERKLIALNAGPGEVRMPVSSGTLVFGTREDRVGEHVSSTLVLAADEAAIVELSGLPSHEAVPQLEA